MGVVVLLISFFGAVLTQSKDDDASLRFYHRTFESYTEFHLDDAYKIFGTEWYKAGKDTIVFAHGFKGYPTGPAITGVINAYLETEHYNVVLLNWEHLAAAGHQSIATAYLNWAAPNARKLGVEFAKTLLLLVDNGLVLNRTHLIGHSLGAQIFGIAGNELAKGGIRLPWVTGLDPASTGFENRPLNLKLHSGSAIFVDIVHSDPSKYGYRKSHGTVDFWPNYQMRGPVQQPGCERNGDAPFTSKDLCNHNRCWELWINALKYPGTVIGRYAKNYRSWRNSSPGDNIPILALGEFGIDAQRGDYFFVTKDAFPYGLGQDGLY